MEYLEILKYTLPALIMFFTVYVVINANLKNDRERRTFELKMANQSNITPVKLQAYERGSDSRKISGQRTPRWFIEPITKGKQYSLLDIYIDTTDESKYVVYYSGYYSRDLDELKKEWGKN